MDIEQGEEIMQLMESSISKSFDFFKEVLDCPFNIQNEIDFFYPDKQEQTQKIFTFIENKEKMGIQGILEPKLEKKCQPNNINKEYEPQQELESEIPTHKIKRRFLNEKNESSKRSTHHQTHFDEGELHIEKSEKHFEPTVDFSSANLHEQMDNRNIDNKKIKRITSQMEKLIMKEKEFGKTLKLSFPKKLVEMFLNHYANFEIENEDIKKYNMNLKSKLKESKKNDYTFEKEVSQILGENETEIEKTFSKEISQINRRIFSEIIKSTMKSEVIMRDKIAKNRELYMIQLKVYALRCRSKKLSKKGTYK